MASITCAKGEGNLTPTEVKNSCGVKVALRVISGQSAPDAIERGIENNGCPLYFGKGYVFACLVT